MINLSICLTDLPKEKIKVAKNGKKYISLMVAERKQESQYGETHTVWVSQTKEERDAGAPTIFVGGGKQYAPKPITAEDIEAMASMGPDEDDDLPF